MSFTVILGTLLIIIPSLGLSQNNFNKSENFNLELQESGRVVINGAKSVNVLGGLNVDTLTWVVYDEPGRSINEFQAILHLPKSVANYEIEHKVLGIKGVQATDSALIDDTTIRFSAMGIGPSAVVSVIVNFPKGYLNLPPIVKAGVAIQELKSVWIYSSILIPLLGLLLLGYMALKRWLDRQLPKNTQKFTKAPSQISPALVSILYENKIEPEAIAAMLVSLAQRGFISIFNKGNNFIFAKERDIDLSSEAFSVGLHEVQLSPQELKVAKKEGLEPFEKILLAKLFVSARPISSKEDVKVRIGHGLFSKKVAAIYEYLFRRASDLGFFVPNAVAVHRKYLVAGWILGIIGFIGFVIGVVTTPDPKYFLLFWIALLGLSYFIIRLAPYVPLRTPSGRKELARFLSWRKFLVDTKPLPKDLSIDDFFANLAYAWGLRAHHQWAKRFENEIFHRPDWYYSSKKINSAPEFINDIDNLIEFVAESFAAVREKTLV